MEALCLEDPKLARDIALCTLQTLDNRFRSGQFSSGFLTPRRITALDRVVQFFRNNNNEWVSMKELSETTGVCNNTLGPMMTKYHKEHFESKKTQYRHYLWRIKTCSAVNKAVQEPILEDAFAGQGSST